MLFYNSLSINDNFFNLFIALYNGDSDYSHITQTEGLPNITGKVYAHLANSDAIYNTGAFDSRSNIGLRNLKSGDSKYSGYYAFNAAAGETKTDGTYKNDVYGKSDHVTTYNSAIQIWRRIG